MKIYYLFNTMMMIIHSLLKIITHANTKKSIRSYPVYKETLLHFAKKHPGDNLNPTARHMYHHTHTHTHTNNLQNKFYSLSLSHTHTSPPTQMNSYKSQHKHSPDCIFRFLKHLFLLPDDCHNKVA